MHLLLFAKAAPVAVMQQLSNKTQAGTLEAIRAADSEIEIMTCGSMAAILGDMGLNAACVEGLCEE